MGNRSVLRVQVKPELLRWARERAHRDIRTLEKIFPRLEAWERGEAKPTLKQLERLAKTLHVPVGYFFMDSPPKESIPIPDFRIMPRMAFPGPSPELLDTIYLCQQRQEWYQNYLLSMGNSPLPFVGISDLNDDPKTVADNMQKRLNLDIEERFNIPNWTQALNRFIDQAESAGILVMVSGVVGSNTHRRLNAEEFRGFVLVDEISPLIFINGTDTVSGKTFTLIHELAHIWMGKSGISNPQISRLPQSRVERWCNRVAAQLLVPEARLEQLHDPQNALSVELNRLANRFKVSTLVILRRLFDLGYLDRETYEQTYQAENKALLAHERARGKGGDFYRSLSRKVSSPLPGRLSSVPLRGKRCFGMPTACWAYPRQRPLRSMLMTWVLRDGISA